MEFAVGVGSHEFSEVTLAQTMTGFVQNNGLHINGVVSIDSPSEGIVVVHFPESHIELAIVVDVSEFTAVNKDKGKGHSQDIAATKDINEEVSRQPASMGNSDIIGLTVEFLQ